MYRTQWLHQYRPNLYLNLEMEGSPVAVVRFPWLQLPCTLSIKKHSQLRVNSELSIRSWEHNRSWEMPRDCETSFTRGQNYSIHCLRDFNWAGHKCMWSLMLIWSLELTSFQASGQSKQSEQRREFSMYFNRAMIKSVHSSRFGSQGHCIPVRWPSADKQWHNQLQSRST